MSSSTARAAGWRSPGNTKSTSNGSPTKVAAAPPLSLSFYNNANNPLTLLSSSQPSTPTRTTKNGYGNYAPTSKNALRPVAVRERSKAIPNCKEINPRAANNDPFSTTISFLITPPKEDKENLPVRVNVFCDTGTIGTAKVVDGKVRQSFRRNVTSLDVLERLLRHPEGPVAIEPSLIGMTDNESKTTTMNTPRTKEDFQKDTELTDAGLCILEGEREKLEKHLRHLNEEEGNQRQPPPEIEQQPQQLPQQPQSPSAGDLQAEMLEKVMAKKVESNGRIGRRRNKFNSLRNRHFNNGKNDKDGNNKDVSDMNNTKRRGGKLATKGKQPDKPNNTMTKSYSSDPSTRSKSKTKDSKDVLGKKKRTNANGNNGTRANNNSDNNARPFKNCGYEFHFKLPADVMNQVDQCLRDIAKMNKVVKGVATNGRGTVFLYGNGGVAYTPAIPKALYHKLRLLRSSSYSSRPCMVALGTRDRYYVSFNDGSADWKGSNSLDKILKKKGLSKHSGHSVASEGSTTTNDPSSTLPRSVAFGGSYDTFFVVFHDGSWQYQGRSIPKSLEDKLAERDDRDDLVVCNLGPSGEWFLKAENGKMWWSGISAELDTVLTQIKVKGGYLHNMDFGENGSYFVSYDEE